jgi:hypothetical protein
MTCDTYRLQSSKPDCHGHNKLTQLTDVEIPQLVSLFFYSQKNSIIIFFLKAIQMQPLAHTPMHPYERTL